MDAQINYKYYLDSHFKQFGSLIVEICHYCPVECAHCHVGSSKKTRLVINDDLLVSSITDFALINGSKIVMFTGGDPFACPGKLRLGLEQTIKNGLKSYTLTSGFWAKTKFKALQLLEKLPNIDLFAVSIDQYHVKKLGVELPFNALFAAIDKGYSCFLCIGHLGINDPFRDEVLSYVTSEYKNKFEVVYYPLLARGSGANLPELSGRELNRSSSQFCFSVGAPIVLSNGNISACCHTNQVNKIRENHNTPLRIGHAKDFKMAINNYLENGFLKLMRIYGPCKIATLIGLELPEDASTWDICRACEYLHDPLIMLKIENYIRTLSSEEVLYQSTLDFINSNGTIDNLISYKNVL